MAAPVPDAAFGGEAFLGLWMGDVLVDTVSAHDHLVGMTIVHACEDTDLTSSDWAKVEDSLLEDPFGRWS